MAPAPALELLARVLRVPRAVVLIDGRSGSGKTTLAAALAARADARLLRLEDLYPGWDGLDAGSAAVVRDVLRPRRAGAAGRFRRWDWPAGRPGETVAVPVDGPLVIEGCGALSADAAPFASAAVWVELRAEDRRRRALERDGDVYRPYWAAWARQEARYLAREHPRALADLEIDGRLLPDRLLSAHPGGGRYGRRP